MSSINRSSGRQLDEGRARGRSAGSIVQSWVRTGVPDRILWALAEDCRDRSGPDPSACVVDGSFVVENVVQFAEACTIRPVTSKLRVAPRVVRQDGV
jgi:hypothetical protein